MQKINKKQVFCSSLEEGLDLIFKTFSLKVCEKSNLVEIAGPSCSGKTYFADKIVEKFLSEMGIITSQLKMDNYYKDRDDPTVRDVMGRINFDWPGAYHVDEFRDAMFLLTRGKDIVEPDYDIRKNRRISNSGRSVEAGRIVVPEGLYVINVLQDIYRDSIKVFIDVNEEIQLQRIKQRNAKYGFSGPVIEKAFYDRIYPCQKKFVISQKKMADIIITNDFQRQRGD